MSTVLHLQLPVYTLNYLSVLSPVFLPLFRDARYSVQAFRDQMEVFHCRFFGVGRSEGEGAQVF